MASRPKVLLIVNPVAGKTKGRTALFPLTEGFCRAGYIPTVHVTGARGDARHITEQLAAQHDLVVCCGGDGTLNEVIDGLLACEKQIPLGYIPAGSTNDFANSLHLKTQPVAALRDILGGSNDAMDIGLFNGVRHFSYIASFGIFTAASYNAPQTTKNALGHFAYLLEGSKELFSVQSHQIVAQTADKRYEGDYLFGAVCNSTSVAGLVKLNAGMVDMSDGLFEVILVRRPMNPAEIARVLNSINTADFDPELFDFFKASEVTFTMKEPLPWSLDGEYAEGAATITVKNVPQAILLRH
ncbi:MAG: diacylglycerol kinase family lipid kinase [Clostridia bacterium]|nr:diacylglycerol kinase family lipid kinase [Clostridia bacterium]